MSEPLLVIGFICLVFGGFYYYDYWKSSAHNRNCYNCEINIDRHNYSDMQIQDDEGKYQNICFTCEKRLKRLQKMKSNAQRKHW